MYVFQTSHLFSLCTPHESLAEEHFKNLLLDKPRGQKIYVWVLRSTVANLESSNPTVI